MHHQHDQTLEIEVMEQYRTGDIGLNKLAELLGIHITDAQHLLKKYHLDLQLTIADLEDDLRVMRQSAR
jgi:predicted HTH domain antitoxin